MKINLASNSLEGKTCLDKRKALIIPFNTNNQVLIQDRRGYKNPG